MGEGKTEVAWTVAHQFVGQLEREKVGPVEVINYDEQRFFADRLVDKPCTETHKSRALRSIELGHAVGGMAL